MLFQGRLPQQLLGTQACKREGRSRACAGTGPSHACRRERAREAPQPRSTCRKSERGLPPRGPPQCPPPRPPAQLSAARPPARPGPSHPCRAPAPLGPAPLLPSLHSTVRPRCPQRTWRAGQLGDFVFCRGTRGFRFCCRVRSGDRTRAPAPATTGRRGSTLEPPPLRPRKDDPRHDLTEDKPSLVVPIICGAVAVTVRGGIFTKLGLEKAPRQQRERRSRWAAPPPSPGRLIHYGSPSASKSR
ncbi:protein shisa-8-like [Hyaena hyaena]|uniref:protein shisa-8-like n=1 Tax=Hyaena hyaena TaxID=95912 RepID=UPI00192122FB|nr:protein shisa-8-like [Hyaena hyaena]